MNLNDLFNDDFFRFRQRIHFHDFQNVEMQIEYKFVVTIFFDCNYVIFEFFQIRHENLYNLIFFLFNVDVLLNLF